MEELTYGFSISTVVVCVGRWLFLARHLRSGIFDHALLRLDFQLGDWYRSLVDHAGLAKYFLNDLRRIL